MMYGDGGVVFAEVDSGRALTGVSGFYQGEEAGKDSSDEGRGKTMQST